MKKTTLKRMLGLTLSFCAMLSLVACGTKDSPAPKPAPDGSSSPALEEISWPEKPITLYVSSSAGGPNDTMCRIVGANLEKQFDVPVTVVNKPGGSSWAAGDTLLSGKRDGYEFCSVVLPAFHKGYLDPSQTRTDTAESFEYLASFANDTSICYINANETRFTDMASLIEYAKNNEVTMTATGVASDDDVCIQKFLRACPDMKASTVFVTGSSESMTAVMGGHVDVGIGNVGDIGTSVEDGLIKVLCVFGEERNTEYLPDVPTFDELKLSDVSVVADSKRGFMYPGGVDEKIVDKMIAALENAYNDPDVQEQFKTAGIPLELFTGDEYREVVMAEAAVMEELGPEFGW